jgi:hypothetical protein
MEDQLILFVVYCKEEKRKQAAVSGIKEKTYTVPGIKFSKYFGDCMDE